MLLVCVGLVVFGGLFPSDVKPIPSTFSCVPFLLWAAFRFGQREVATAIALLSSIAVWGTLGVRARSCRRRRTNRWSCLQAYTSVMAVMGAALATVVMQQKLAESQLHELAITDPLTQDSRTTVG